ncbi:MAG: 3-hydroxypropionyl-coenzyme A synthetase [Methanocella sp. PtaU1.Bin125]|nr:MAG: 3-hydroxypropionyl-coenzyme A synthetase [Methanocella sp. PtaU1.Bin125]
MCVEQPPTTVSGAINTAGNPGDIAIMAPGKEPMSYEKLRLQVRTTVDALHAMGYGHGDRIAVSLPNGPEMAVAFLAVASAFTCVPLNPGCREQEVTACLAGAKADAIILPSGAVAASPGVPVITLSPAGGEAGGFTIAGEARAGNIDRAPAAPDDIGMLLYTSGTTARPKLVPLTQSGMVGAALNMAVPLALTREDRCLNVSPLYYVGGLLGSLLGTIATGGSVVCAPGFQPERFFEWLRAYRPTWYTSVPAIHQHVLQLATERPDEARMSGLRLIRTSAAAMPQAVREGLEQAFGVPVIEAYGMTEAPHQIATNPLPPLPRKPGSVGRGVGVEIAVVDGCGQIMRPGGRGEVVIRGPGVTRGYENDPAANATAFYDGWFHTGDLGHLDGDGYLFLDGRIKETINRGGDKISPAEIEEALLSHPAVAEAAAFAVPDPVLGENVGAAVVLHAGTDVTPETLRKHVAGRLAYFKVPARVWAVAGIPRGPTGKVQRIGLYDRLGHSMETPGAPDCEPVPCATPTEQALAEIWARVLGRDHIGRLDSFIDLGGDSLQATMVLSRVRESFGVAVPIARMMDCDDLAALARLVDDLKAGRDDGRHR